ncbi:hypothetical protein WICANDRAFT_61348 [Wickerhamomyces anomalus NRRL Y-366-8]|uniref:Uncharacterized protein n=1 Tax=Wickerhamomyces anomalus (strain ATCC 58044 / CBS 1984 / NCYC 433 / NRRL Y-366-8) TaxID=683960 RepID=A0A1E3P5Z1_WICAA|nr:uncharacterized protein WICANDRAFT_61348 [Wickerhamomyces anomalus NRRL Y-366-8]ODQ60783.1 hypothetical protein WICANDRAFT_61348 [Wickerhamomyces anomalus NRRL Y-366-8]
MVKLFSLLSFYIPTLMVTTGAIETFSGLALQRFLRCVQTFAPENYQYGISMDKKIIIFPEIRRHLNITGTDGPILACIQGFLTGHAEMTMTERDGADMYYTFQDGIHQLNAGAQEHIEQFELVYHDRTIPEDMLQRMNQKLKEHKEKYG